MLVLTTLEPSVPRRACGAAHPLVVQRLTSTHFQPSALTASAIPCNLSLTRRVSVAISEMYVPCSSSAANRSRRSAPSGFVGGQTNEPHALVGREISSLESMRRMVCALQSHG